LAKAVSSTARNALEQRTNFVGIGTLFEDNAKAVLTVGQRDFLYVLYDGFLYRELGLRIVLGKVLPREGGGSKNGNHSNYHQYYKELFHGYSPEARNYRVLLGTLFLMTTVLLCRNDSSESRHNGL
jgi:hypothetical protein